MLKSTLLTLRFLVIVSVCIVFSESRLNSIRIRKENSLDMKSEGFVSETNSERKASIIFLPKKEYWIREARKALTSVLSLFSLWNNECWTPNYDQGTCSSRSRKQCLSEGGIPDGVCAGGFGVCCLHIQKCGMESPFNRTYFTNPNFPHYSEDLGLCSHASTKLEGICQIRIDFEVFELDPPGEDGRCRKAWLWIEGTERPLPPFCGHLTGHHIYLSTGFDPTLRLNLELGPGGFWRRWRLRLTKLGCSSPSIAPGGCLQNYIGLFGRVTSLNYANQNLARLDYGACVRKEKGFCAIEWSVCKENGWNRLRRSLNKKVKNATSEVSVNSVTTLIGNGWTVNCDERNGQRTPREEAICRISSTGWRPFFPSWFREGNSTAQNMMSSNASFDSSQNIRFIARKGVLSPKVQKSKDVLFGFVRNPANKVLKPANKEPKPQPQPPRFYQQLKVPSKPSALQKSSPHGLLKSKGNLVGLKRIRTKVKLPLINLKSNSGGALGIPHIRTKPKLKFPSKKLSSLWRPKVKPKPVIKVPPKGYLGKYPSKLSKVKGSVGNCRVTPIPVLIPLPIPIPIPISPVVVVPFPVSESGMKKKGWNEDGKVISATEPFLLRIRTEDEKLDSFCMEWEQIPCHTWWGP